LLPRFTRQVADHGTIEASSAPNRLSTELLLGASFLHKQVCSTEGCL